MRVERENINSKKEISKKTTIRSLVISSIVIIILTIIFVTGLYLFYHYYNMLDRSAYNGADGEINVSEDIAEDFFYEEGELAIDSYEEIEDASPEEIISIEETLEKTLRTWPQTPNYKIRTALIFY